MKQCRQNSIRPANLRGVRTRNGRIVTQTLHVDVEVEWVHPFDLAMRTGDDLSAAYDLIESEGPKVFAFDQTAWRSIRGLAGSGRGHAPIQMSELTAMRALEDLLRSADETWTARASCEQAIGLINRPELRHLDAAVAVAQACLRITNRRLDVGVPVDVAYAVSTLGARAQATSHEISALLRAGFPGGAQARWRTLYEVAVTSSVLMLGNRYPASRFKNHRWIMLARDRDHVDGLAPWPDRRSPEQMRERLVRQYGPEYADRYGWASPVTLRRLGIRRPQWHHLERTADLAGGYRHRVKSAHHSVHVDSMGGLDLLDSSGTLHAGSRIEGGQPVIWQTIHALAEATDSLLALWQRYDSTPLIAASRAYADRLLFELETDVSRRHGHDQ